VNGRATRNLGRSLILEVIRVRVDLSLSYDLAVATRKTTDMEMNAFRFVLPQSEMDF